MRPTANAETAREAMSNGREYGRLGQVLDGLARSRNIRGPGKVARHVKEKTGRGPNASAWWQIFYGETKQPRSEIIELFAEAFELTTEEKRWLAWVYAFPSQDL